MQVIQNPLFNPRKLHLSPERLPAAEFALNAQHHSGIFYSLFELMYRDQPDITIPTSHCTNILSLEERLDRIEKAQKDAKAAL